ncbi:MAG TPA: hypothetical protein VFG80_03500 [Myxococcota bacterium]|nr:hypothetical protein [Myxococcota bacterium]
MAENELHQLRWRFLDWRPVLRPQSVPQLRPYEPSEELLAGLADLEEFIREVGGGRIGPPTLGRAGITVPMQARDGAIYFLRIHAAHYLEAPPRCTFVDGQGRFVPAAWPAYHPSGPFRPPNFICTPPTAEFHHYHPEHRYQRETGTLVNTVATIYTALQASSYRGRYGEED